MGDIKIWIDFVIKNSIELQKLILEGEISWLMSSHVHTWAKTTSPSIDKQKKSFTINEWMQVTIKVFIKFFPDHLHGGLL